MKLKQFPDDFRVEEFPNIQAGKIGPFALYRLEKEGWTTPDALSIVRRRWQIDSERISYGGLKDRHASTIQYFSIFRGPTRKLQHKGVQVEYLGQITHPYTSNHFRANGFQLTLRAMSSTEVEHATQILPAIANVGVPNYFDDQRFGSVGDGRSFVAKALVQGNFEEALKLALASHYAYDLAAAKQEKAILLEHWNDWVTCKSKLSKGHARSIVDYLIHHPTNYKGAILRMRPELKTLYLSAWQSHLWNLILAQWFQKNLTADQLFWIDLKTAKVPLPKVIPAELRVAWDSLDLPLPSARLRWDPNASWAPLIETVMSNEGIPISEMKIRGMQQPFFSRGERLGKIPVDKLTWQVNDDEVHPGKSKLVLQFELPRGCYATMLVKCITQGEMDPLSEDTAPSDPHLTSEAQDEG